MDKPFITTCLNILVTRHRQLLFMAAMLLCLVSLVGCGGKQETRPEAAPAPAPAEPKVYTAPAPPPPPPPPAPKAAPRPEPAPAPYPKPEAAPAPAPYQRPPAAAYRRPAQAPTPAKAANKYEEYKVVLGADPLLRIPGPPGRLKVWLGIPDFAPKFPAGMKEAAGSLPALGATARITPLAEAFEIEPKQTECVKIDPTGSEVSFKLTPTRGGEFDVGAEVKLYDSKDCGGAPIPKASTTLKVKVEVRTLPPVDVFKEKLREAILKFWVEVLALASAVTIFVMRKKLKKWTGFDKEDKDGKG